MTTEKAVTHTPGPWVIGTRRDGSRWFSIGDPAKGPHYQADIVCSEADACLIAAAPDLLAALKEGRRAIGEHNAPHDCYATGPATGNDYRDLVECPACSFIAMYDAAISKAEPTP